MSLRATSALSSALFAITCLAAPAMAQTLSADQAWAELEAAATAQGIALVSSGRENQGDALVIQNLRIMPAGTAKDLVISIPELRLHPVAEGVALQPSPEFTAMARFPGQITRFFTVRNDGDIVYDANSEAIDLMLSMGHLSLELTRSVQRGQPMDETLTLNFEEMESQLDLERAGHMDFALTSLQTTYDVEMDLDGATEMDGSISDLRVEFGGREFDMIDDDADALERAVEAGFGAYLRIYSGQSSGGSVQELDGMRVQASSSTEQSHVEMEIAEGRFEFEGTATNGAVEGTYGPFPFAGTIASMDMGIAGPVVRTPDMQPVHYGVALDELLLSPQVLSMFNAQNFADEPLTFRFRASADARITEDLAVYSGDEPPFDASEARLDELLVRVGDSSLSGAGAFTFLGGFLASINNEVPDGTGDFNFELVGGNALLERLVNLGLVPQEQIFVVQMMMNGLGRAVGEDHLVSEVTIRPGGDVRVNGAPLPF